MGRTDGKRRRALPGEVVQILIVVAAIAVLRLFMGEPAEGPRARGAAGSVVQSWSEQHSRPLLSGPHVAELGAKTNPYTADYEFSRDAFTWNLPVWNAVLAPYKGRPGVRYLEVGLFEGRSALWMLQEVLTHPSSRAVGIEPFGDPYGIENVEARFYSNLEKSGAADRLEVIKGYSQIELRRLPLESFDIIYIDGSHLAVHVLEDAVLSYRLLKQGGLLIFDDYLYRPEVEWTERPHEAIDTFYSFFRGDLEVVHAGYQVVLRRRPSDSGG